MTELVGLPLDTALARLHEQGRFPRVRMTQAPRRPVEQGEVRVLRVSRDGAEVLAAVFPQPLAIETGEEGLC